MSTFGNFGDGKVIAHGTSPDYSGDKLIYRVTEYVKGRLYIVSETGGEPIALPVRESEYEGVSWVGNSRLVYERQSPDFKDRNIVTVDVRNGTEHVLHTDHEPNFWSLPDEEAGGEPLPSPDGKWIAWISDATDGWDHLYIAPSDGGEPIQISSGHSEAWRPAWSHDSHALAFDINDSDHPGDRRVAVASIGTDPAHPTVQDIGKAEGTNTEPQWSPADNMLVYQHTDWQG
jgi:Tol biopolymer transport system component